MMERQEHLMTKAFLNTDTNTAFQQQHPAHQPGYHGDFLTWRLDKPSPTRNTRTHETAVAEQGNHPIQFDDVPDPSPTDGTLSEPSDMAYHIEMPPMAAYKYEPEEGDDGFQEDELARQMREIADHDGTAAGGLPGLDALGDGESGSRDLFGGYGGDFGDPYMNGTLGELGMATGMTHSDC
jgi:hypothetical protein